jgi:hypothetical protein
LIIDVREHEFAAKVAAISDADEVVLVSGLPPGPPALEVTDDDAGEHSGDTLILNETPDVTLTGWPELPALVTEHSGSGD